MVRPNCNTTQSAQKAQFFMEPFPHLVRYDLATEEEITAINYEWPTNGWSVKSGKTSIKSHTRNLPPTAQAVVSRLTSQSFRDELSDIFEIPNLLVDPDQYGGGLHQIQRGGFLKMHVDFNQHPSGLWRRINLLLYINQKWNCTWGSDLDLGIDRSVSIIPHAGTAVIFPTTEESYHGHPDPLMCPNTRARRSIAIYYYTVAPPPNAKPPHTTIYLK